MVMRNFLKFASLPVCLLLSVLCFTSCEDNDDDFNYSELYGQWELVSKHTWAREGENETEYTSSPQEGDETIVIFRQNNIILRYIKNSEYEGGYDIIEQYYELSDNEILTSLDQYSSKSLYRTITELDDDHLVLSSYSASVMGNSVISESETEFTYKRIQ